MNKKSILYSSSTRYTAIDHDNNAFDDVDVYILSRICLKIDIK